MNIMQCLQTSDTAVNRNNGESTLNACKYMPSYAVNIMTKHNISQSSTTFYPNNLPWCLRKSLPICCSICDWRQSSVFQPIVGRCASNLRPTHDLPQLLQVRSYAYQKTVLTKSKLPWFRPRLTAVSHTVGRHSGQTRGMIVSAPPAVTMGGRACLVMRQALGLGKLSVPHRRFITGL